MPELTKHNIFVPLDGLSQEHESDGTRLGEHTVNFFPDGEGYLVNYPGKVKYFKFVPDDPEPIDPQDPGINDLSSTPGAGPGITVYTKPPEGKFTRIKLYRDSSKQAHIVFVVDNKLCVVEGNGYRVLYTFVGVQRDGGSYPEIFTHQNYLVVANLGDPVLMWDGFQDAVPLGVTEVPDPPTVSVGLTPWYTNLGERKNEDGRSVHIRGGFTGKGDPSLAGGDFSRYGYWGNPGVWYSGPIDYEPGGHYIGMGVEIDDKYDPSKWADTYWSWKVQYYDRYGNKGPPSAASAIVQIPKNKAFMVYPAWPETTTFATVPLTDWDGKHWATVYWRPPKHDWHIQGVILYKTLDLSEYKANSPDVYYFEYSQDNVNCTRHTSIAGDSTLTDGTVMGQNVGGPPSTDLAASWGTRIIMRDPIHKERMLYSDATQMGQFRPSHVYKARDTIEALLPLGDRLLIVTQSTSEILYYNRDGNIAHLETHENKGSYYGRSFAVFGDQAFGLFNDGFFLFNGQSFAQTKSPYFLQKDYIDRWHDVQNSVVQGEWYFLSIRKEMMSDENNFILMCHLPTSRWFQVEESVRDMEVSGEYILGVSDSIYFLYRGAEYPKSSVHLRGVLNKDLGILRESTLSALALFIDPASKKKVTVEITGHNEFEKKTGSGISYPSKSTVRKQTEYYPSWNDGKSQWGENNWVAPNDFHVELQLDNNITAYKHDVKLEFAAGNPQRIKAITAEYSVGSNVADKE